MENVAPGSLQRLRAADIIRLASLTSASLGQEYCRAGAVHATQRQGARLSGIVDVPHPSGSLVAMSDDGDATDTESRSETRPHRYSVEVEIKSTTSWISNCSCNPTSSILCPHAAALLYQWLARPTAFIVTNSPADVADTARVRRDAAASGVEGVQTETLLAAARSSRLPGLAAAAGNTLHTQPGPAPLSNVLSILTQLGLSDLRSVAREYELATNGMNKQQLAEAILETLKQPEAVRRVAATLEKPQRQLLAALTLTGGSITDDDLRGLFERFALGQPGQLQGVLLALQGKALLFRTSLNSATPQRAGLSGTLLDIGWYVPAEVRAALRVSVPVTVFDMAQQQESSRVQLAEPDHLLADLLLVARALDGYHLRPEDVWQESVSGSAAKNSSDGAGYGRPSGLQTTDGSVPIPPPLDLPSPALLASLQANVELPPMFLHFAARLLRLADILHQDDGGAAYLRVLPNAAQTLLGPLRQDVLHDLFEIWLAQASYGELYDLQEDNVRLRCRATALGMPILRSGELDVENSEARQSVVALLAQVPLNQWISFFPFARFVYRLNPFFLQRRQRLFPAPHWWMEQETGRPLRPAQLNDWLRAEHYYLARLISGPLHWWGICDIIAADDGRLLAFRLTPLAAWLLHSVRPDDLLATMDYSTPVDPLEVIDSEEVLIRCAAQTWPIIAQLETFTSAAGVRRDRLRYRLTPRALGDALSRGHRPEALLALFRQSLALHAQHAGPLQHMINQLEQWISSYGRIRLYTGVSLLETADTTVMRELSATTSLDEQLVQAIHPTLLILKPGATERLIDELKRRGQSPLLHDEDFYGPE